MKQCPTCNRTYADQSMRFCLDDGAVLSAANDPEATLVMPTANTDRQPDEALPLTSPHPHTQSQSINPKLMYVAIGLLALLVGGGIVALLKSSAKVTSPTENPENLQASKPELTPRLSSALPKQASTLSPEEHEWTVTVPSTIRWFNTDIQVQKGTKLYLHATGSVTWSPDYCGNCKTTVNPNGTRPPFRDYEGYSLFPMPEVGIGSLVMRIGKVEYAVGADASVTVKESGVIELMVNDDNLSDNSGNYTVQIKS